MNGFRCARFRHYAPLEFTTSYLNWAENKEDINNGVKLAKEYKIKIEDCKFRYSKGEYMCDRKTNSIYKGIGSIKYLNKICADQLYELRENSYNTFIDILKDISEKRIKIDARQINILILLGYFSEFGKTKKLKEAYEIFSNLYGKKQIKKADIGCNKKYNIPINMVEKYSARITEKTFMDVDMIGLLNEVYTTLEDKEINIKEKIKSEVEFLEYPNTVIPDLKEDLFFVMEIKEYKNKRSITRYLKLYSIKTGEEVAYKLSDFRLFAEQPIEEKDVIRITSESKKPKKRKNENGDWKVVEGEFNNSLDDWKIF